MRGYALKAARAAGIRVRLDGDGLELEARAPPPPAVLDLLSHYKADILRLLRPANDAGRPKIGRYSLSERAAIVEFDGGLPRAEAEARAFACCVAEWLNRQPHAIHAWAVPWLRRWGATCRSVAAIRDRYKRSRLATSPCWPAWHRAREAEAVAAMCRNLGAHAGQAEQMGEKSL